MTRSGRDCSSSSTRTTPTSSARPRDGPPRQSPPVGPRRRDLVHRHARCFASLGTGRAPPARRASCRSRLQQRRCVPRRAASARGDLERLVEVSHPIVRAHPETGVPALYFDLDRARHIEGSRRRRASTVQSLQDRAEQTAPRYDHQWQPHDVLIWDNASVQHKAGGDFPSANHAASGDTWSTDPDPPHIGRTTVRASGAEMTAWRWGGLQGWTNRATKSSDVCATSCDPWSMVSECPRSAISWISVTPGFRFWRLYNALAIAHGTV